MEVACAFIYVVCVNVKMAECEHLAGTYSIICTVSIL